MDSDWKRPTRGPTLAEQASPTPRFPTDKERAQIAAARERGRRDQQAMRAAGFGDHKGVEGF